MKAMFAVTFALALAACRGQEVENVENTANEVASVDPLATGNVGPLATGDMAVGAGEVRVTISGVQANGGPVLVALQDESQFAKQAGAFSTRVEPRSSVVLATFRGVAPGDYVAAAVQDRNGDGTFTIGDTGPTEPFGFSGAPQIGAPSFGPASFRVTATGGSASVTLTDGPGP